MKRPQAPQPAPPLPQMPPQVPIEIQPDVAAFCGALANALGWSVSSVLNDLVRVAYFHLEHERISKVYELASEYARQNKRVPRSMFELDEEGPVPPPPPDPNAACEPEKDEVDPRTPEQIRADLRREAGLDKPSTPPSASRPADPPPEDEGEPPTEH